MFSFKILWSQIEYKFRISKKESNLILSLAITFYTLTKMGLVWEQLMKLFWILVTLMVLLCAVGYERDETEGNERYWY
jgi:hypothetical protein